MGHFNLMDQFIADGAGPNLLRRGEDYCYIHGSRRGSFLLFAINYRDRYGMGERALARFEKFYDVVGLLRIHLDTFVNLSIVNRFFSDSSWERSLLGTISVLFEDV